MPITPTSSATPMDTSSIMPEPQIPTATQTDNIKDVAQQFESLFLDIVLKSMRKGMPESDFIKRSNAEEVYTSMLDSEYSKIMSRSNQTGLAEQIEEQMRRTMGTPQNERHQQGLEATGQKVYSKARLFPSQK